MSFQGSRPGDSPSAHSDRVQYLAPFDRKKLFATDDMDDLLALQAQFMQSQAQPSASVSTAASSISTMNTAPRTTVQPTDDLTTDKHHVDPSNVMQTLDTDGGRSNDGMFDALDMLTGHKPGIEEALHPSINQQSAVIDDDDWLLDQPAAFDKHTSELGNKHTQSTKYIRVSGHVLASQSQQKEQKPIRFHKPANFGSHLTSGFSIDAMVYDDDTENAIPIPPTTSSTHGDAPSQNSAPAGSATAVTASKPTRPRTKKKKQVIVLDNSFEEPIITPARSVTGGGATAAANTAAAVVPQQPTDSNPTISAQTIPDQPSSVPEIASTTPQEDMTLEDTNVGLMIKSTLNRPSSPTLEDTTPSTPHNSLPSTVDLSHTIPPVSTSRSVLGDMQIGHTRRIPTVFADQIDDQSTTTTSKSTTHDNSAPLVHLSAPVVQRIKPKRTKQKAIVQMDDTHIQTRHIHHAAALETVMGSTGNKSSTAAPSAFVTAQRAGGSSSSSLATSSSSSLGKLSASNNMYNTAPVTRNQSVATTKHSEQHSKSVTTKQPIVSHRLIDTLPEYIPTRLHQQQQQQQKLQHQQQQQRNAQPESFAGVRKADIDQTVDMFMSMLSDDAAKQDYLDEALAGIDPATIAAFQKLHAQSLASGGLAGGLSADLAEALGDPEDYPDDDDDDDDDDNDNYHNENPHSEDDNNKQQLTLGEAVANALASKKQQQQSTSTKSSRQSRKEHLAHLTDPDQNPFDVLKTWHSDIRDDENTTVNSSRIPTGNHHLTQTASMQQRQKHSQRGGASSTQAITPAVETAIALLQKSPLYNNLTTKDSSLTALTTQLTDLRFDMDGHIIPFIRHRDGSLGVPQHIDFSSNRELFHHGKQPGRPGYTIDELITLIRSTNAQQVALACQMMAKVVTNARCGLYNDILPHQMDLYQQNITKYRQQRFYPHQFQLKNSDQGEHEQEQQHEHDLGIDIFSNFVNNNISTSIFETLLIRDVPLLCIHILINNNNGYDQNNHTTTIVLHTLQLLLSFLHPGITPDNFFTSTYHDLPFTIPPPMVSSHQELSQTAQRSTSSPDGPLLPSYWIDTVCGDDSLVLNSSNSQISQYIPNLLTSQHQTTNSSSPTTTTTLSGNPYVPVHYGYHALPYTSSAWTSSYNTKGYYLHTDTPHFSTRLLQTLFFEQSYQRLVQLCVGRNIAISLVQTPELAAEMASPQQAAAAAKSPTTSISMDDPDAAVVSAAKYAQECFTRGTTQDALEMLHSLSISQIFLYDVVIGTLSLGTLEQLMRLLKYYLYLTDGTILGMKAASLSSTSSQKNYITSATAAAATNNTSNNLAGTSSSYSMQILILQVVLSLVMHSPTAAAIVGLDNDLLPLLAQMVSVPCLTRFITLSRNIHNLKNDSNHTTTTETTKIAIAEYEDQMNKITQRNAYIFAILLQISQSHPVFVIEIDHHIGSSLISFMTLLSAYYSNDNQQQSQQQQLQQRNDQPPAFNIYMSRHVVSMLSNIAHFILHLTQSCLALPMPCLLNAQDASIQLLVRSVMRILSHLLPLVQIQSISTSSSSLQTYTTAINRFILLLSSLDIFMIANVNIFTPTAESLLQSGATSSQSEISSSKSEESSTEHSQHAVISTTIALTAETYGQIESNIFSTTTSAYQHNSAISSTITQTRLEHLLPLLSQYASFMQTLSPVFCSSFLMYCLPSLGYLCAIAHTTNATIQSQIYTLAVTIMNHSQQFISTTRRSCTLPSIAMTDSIYSAIEFHHALPSLPQRFITTNNSSLQFSSDIISQQLTILSTIIASISSQHLHHFHSNIFQTSYMSVSYQLSTAIDVLSTFLFISNHSLHEQYLNILIDSSISTNPILLAANSGISSPMHANAILFAIMKIAQSFKHWINKPQYVPYLVQLLHSMHIAYVSSYYLLHYFVLTHGQKEAAMITTQMLFNVDVVNILTALPHLLPSTMSLLSIASSSSSSFCDNCESSPTPTTESIQQLVDNVIFFISQPSYQQQHALVHEMFTSLTFSSLPSLLTCPLPCCPSTYFDPLSSRDVVANNDDNDNDAVLNTSSSRTQQQQQQQQQQQRDSIDCLSLFYNGTWQPITLSADVTALPQSPAIMLSHNSIWSPDIVTESTSLRGFILMFSLIQHSFGLLISAAPQPTITHVPVSVNNSQPSYQQQQATSYTWSGLRSVLKTQQLTMLGTLLSQPEIISSSTTNSQAIPINEEDGLPSDEYISQKITEIPHWLVQSFIVEVFTSYTFNPFECLSLQTQQTQQQPKFDQQKLEQQSLHTHAPLINNQLLPSIVPFIDTHWFLLENSLHLYEAIFSNFAQQGEYALFIAFIFLLLHSPQHHQVNYSLSLVTEQLSMAVVESSVNTISTNTSKPAATTLVTEIKSKNDILGVVYTICLQLFAQLPQCLHSIQGKNISLCLTSSVAPASSQDVIAYVKSHCCDLQTSGNDVQQYPDSTSSSPIRVMAGFSLSYSLQTLQLSQFFQRQNTTNHTPPHLAWTLQFPQESYLKITSDKLLSSSSAAASPSPTILSSFLPAYSHIFMKIFIRLWPRLHQNDTLNADVPYQSVSQHIEWPSLYVIARDALQSMLLSVITTPQYSNNNNIFQITSLFHVMYKTIVSNHSFIQNDHFNQEQLVSMIFSTLLLEISSYNSNSDNSSNIIGNQSICKQQLRNSCEYLLTNELFVDGCRDADIQPVLTAIQHAINPKTNK